MQAFRWTWENGWVPEPESPWLSAALEARPELAEAPALCVLPPLWDHHGHVYWYGALLEQADLRGARSPREVLVRLESTAARLPEGAWLEGFGWDQNLWEGFPPRAFLDSAFPERPCYLRRIDGHSGWVNSAALRRAGIQEDAPDPEGGVFLREGGRLSGFCLDRAMETVASAIPAPDAGTVRRRISKALRALGTAGLSGATDMGLEPDHVEALKALDGCGEMAVPTEGFFWIRDEATEPGKPYQGRSFRLGGCKFFSDGALGSRGAALYEDYADDPGNRGLLLWEAPALARKIRQIISLGFSPAIHAIGDRACALVLDALDASGCGLQARIEHLQVLGHEDLKRLAKLGGTASIQPCHFLSDSAWAQARLGSRMPLAYRAGSFHQAGVPLLLGTDFPIEVPDPWRNFLACETRQPEGERLPLAAVLAAMAPPRWAARRGSCTLAACEAPGLLGSPRTLFCAWNGGSLP